MTVFKLQRKLSLRISALQADKKSIGLVPTMGALHKGHLSLVKKALNENYFVIVSIFVNPTQFDNKQDLEKYPRNLDHDLELLNTLEAKNIIVYAPSKEDIYNNNIVSEVFDFSGLDKMMEGTHRKGHFNGVATIVKHLLLITKPNKAYFGEKDFQQLQIIKKLVEDYQIPVKIVGCPIIREQDGLAMSSRNKRLTKTQRELTPFIHKTLKTAKKKFGTKSATKITEWVNHQFSKQPLLELEYFIIADAKTLKKVIRKSNKKSYRAFIAVYIGEVRLIDNMALN